MQTATDRIRRISARCRTEPQVARLWNWIDHQPFPEPLWSAMWHACPFSAGELPAWLQTERKTALVRHG